MSLVVQNLAERCFEAIRDQILSGSLPAEGPIRQEALASALGVSKVPLREALTRLEKDGLIAGQANRGWIVCPLDLDQLDEIRQLRLSVEPVAAARACRLAGESDRETVRTAAHACSDALGGSLVRLTACYRELHIALVRPGRRLVTTQLVERLSLITERYAIAAGRRSGSLMTREKALLALSAAWTDACEAKVKALLARLLIAEFDEYDAALADRSQATRMG